MMRSSFALLLILVSSFSYAYPTPDGGPNLGTGNWDCNKALQLAPGEIDKVNKDFIHLPKALTYEVPATPVDNQCQIGFCWIYATAEEIQERLLRQGKTATDLSEEFVGVQALIIRAQDALASPGQSISEGGWYSGARWLIQTRGVVPENVWKPKEDFIRGKAPGRLIGFLNSRIAKFHIDFAVAKATGASEAQLINLKNDAGQNLMELIEMYTGKIPEKFLIDGKWQTPVEYAKTLIGENVKTVKIAPSAEALPIELQELANTAKTVALPITNRIPWKTDLSLVTKTFDGMEKHIIARLRSGKSVVGSIEINRSYIDNVTGIMAIEAFHNPIGFEPTSNAYRSNFDQMFGGHLIEITGVDVDATGHIVKLKIKNSWGEDIADHGYYYAYSSYLKLYLKAIFFEATPEEMIALTPKK